MKNKKVQSLCAVALAAALTLTSLTGCGAKQTTGSSSAAGSDVADLVLKNGEIQTLATDDDVQQAVAVKDGEIVFVGSDKDVESYIGDDTNVIDLDGGYVTPGLIDAHTHDVQALMVQMYQCYLSETEGDVTAYQKVLKEYADANPDVEIIHGGSIDLNAFENGIPTAAWIDEIVSDKPVILTDMSLHGRCLNTKAMEELGITKDTPDPEGGKIYRDADGNPTGYVSDCQNLVAPIDNTEYTEEQYKEAFKEYQTHANSEGITSIDLGGNEIAEPGQWKALSELAESGELNLRVGGTMWSSGASDGWDNAAENDIKTMEDGQQYASDFLKISCVKVKLDGVPEGASSYLLGTYAESSGLGDDYNATLAVSEEDLTAYTIAMNKAGYQVQVHAMGDGSVNVALNAFEASIAENGNKDYRNIITHANLVATDDIARMGKLKVYAAMQPMWFYYDPAFSPLELNNFGQELFDTEYMIKDMEDAGVIITGSADFPITEDNPLDAIEVGTTQCSPFEGEEDDDAYLRHADQVVEPINALKWYTTNGASQMEMEDTIGTIEVGKKADFAVMGKNIVTCDNKEINEAGILYTISDGRIVYQAK